MLNENQINLLPERITQRLSDINTEYLESIGAVLKEIGELRPKDVHQLQQMYKHGADVDKVIEKLSRESAKNVAEIYEIFDIVAKDNYNYAEPFYKAKKKAFIPYEDNKELQGYVKSLAKQTVNEYINLTQHTAFAVFDTGGKSIAPLFAKNKDKVATSLSDTYTKIIDYAVTKVQLGGESYNSAMREVIKAMANSGIKTVDYATGYTRRLDTAVRQNILWGVKECNQNTADRIGQEFGADGYEISYHSNPRPTHADMGGGQYAIGKARTINGVYYPSFSDVEDLLEDFGCLHFKFSILLGISSPAYSKAQLEEFKANDNKVFEFEGKKYTGYEATQMQRKLETAIRNERDLLKTAKAFGNNELINEAKTKINLLTSKYAQFSKVSGLSTKMERTRLGMKNIDNSAKSGIMNMYRKKGTYRKNANDGHKIIDKPTYHKIINPVIKKGADVRIATGEWLEHLEKADAYAVTIGDVIYFREDATVSDVLEETYHFKQNLKGLNNRYGYKQREIMNEIDAKEYLLSVVDKYKIPEEETALTIKQLRNYKNQRKELKARGEWDD